MQQQCEAYYVRCHGANLNNGFAEGPNKFTILTDEHFDVTELRVGFEGPSQPELKLVTRKNRNVDVTFVPWVGGDYKIHIKYKGDYIYNSPFLCKIIGDVRASVKKMVCSGNIKQGSVGSENSILIDGRVVCINGGLVAQLIGPSKADLRFARNEDGTVSFLFMVTESGEYKLNLKFQHYHIPGSPFLIVCAN